MAALFVPTSRGFRCAVICITGLHLVCTAATLFIKMILTLTPCFIWGSAFTLFAFTVQAACVLAIAKVAFSNHQKQHGVPKMY